MVDRRTGLVLVVAVDRALTRCRRTAGVGSVRPGRVRSGRRRSASGSAPGLPAHAPHVRGVVVRPLDVRRPTVPAEGDGPHPGPLAEVTADRVEPRSRLEAQGPGVADGAEHKLLRQLERRGDRRLPETGEERPGEQGVLLVVENSRSDDVLDTQAVQVDQVPAGAHRAPPGVAGDQHRRQPRGVGRGPGRLRPPESLVDQQARAPAGAHPAGAQFPRGERPGVGLGRPADERRRGDAGHPQHPGDLPGRVPVGAQ